jgi:hypothetical protein
MNRDLFNKNKKAGNTELENDPNWANDVSVQSIEDKIKQDHRELREALRPLSADDKNPIDTFLSLFSKKEKSDKTSSASDKSETANEGTTKFFSKKFLLSLAIYSGVLVLLITLFLIRFFFYLKDYEKTYELSLPYHNADSFIQTISGNNAEEIYSSLTNKPVLSEYETKDNVVGYIDAMTKDKQLSYAESNDSTDKKPVYHIIADDYIIGELVLTQSAEKRKHDLPIYRIDSFSLFSEPEWDATIKTYDDCKVYVNGKELTKDYLEKSEKNDETHFEDFAELADVNYYKIDGLYQRPDIKIVNAFDQELVPSVNETTGFYETPLSAPKDMEDEMIAFAKDAVATYSSVVCREINDSNLDRIFTKGNPIVHDIKTNSGNLMYFPNHITKETEDKIIDFKPYNENAFYCEMEHTQHMLVYGVRPRDVVTDTRFYYTKENGQWRVCAVIY